MAFKTQARLCPLVFMLSASMTNCKFTSSTAKDAQTDAIKALLPPGLVALNISSDQLEKYVPPADGHNGIPATLEGIWWTDAHSIDWVVSFQNVYWNPTTRTASLLWVGPGMYSMPGHSGAAPSIADPQGYAGYDITFTPDLKQATLFAARSDSSDTRTSEDLGYTMTFEGDGHWIRHTVGMPDYHLRRIVKADGTRDVAYASYLQRFGATAQIYAPVQSLSDATPTVVVDLKDQEADTIIEVKDIANAHAVVLNAEADFLVTMKAAHDSGHIFNADVDGKHLFVNTERNRPNIVMIRPKDHTGGKVKLTFSVIPSTDLTPAAPSGVVALRSDSITYANIAVDQAHSGLYRIKFDAGSSPFAVSVPDLQLEHVSTKELLAYLDGLQPLNLYFAPQPAGGSVQISFAAEPQSTRAAGAIDGSGGTFSGSLANVGAADVFNLSAPNDATNLHNVVDVEMLADANSQTSLSFASGSDVASDLKLRPFFRQHEKRYDIGRSLQMLIRYRGDLNIANPPLGYHFSVKMKSSAIKFCQSIDGSGFGPQTPCANGNLCALDDFGTWVNEQCVVN